MTAVGDPVSGTSDCAAAFALVADRQPGRPAVVEDGRVTTFGALQSDVVRRADALLDAGVRSGDRVALVAESSAGFLATALAVWRIGGVLVTVYPSSGADDLRYALESSDPVLVVAGAEVGGRVVAEAAGATPVTSVEDFAPVEVRAGTAPNPEGLREPLSLICFSSGTTSRPKAIMVSARTVLNCAETYGEVWHFGPDDRGIVCLPMAWMYGLASTSLALLLRGATAVVVRRSRPEVLLAALVDQRATFLAGVTTTFTRLVHHLENNPVGPTAFEALRLCISGGEPRNEEAFERWRSLSGAPVFDAYCSSECLPLVTYDPWEDAAPKPGAAGRLVPRARLKIVDQTGSEVPPGEVGEGLSSGPGLMLGYWRDPELTREVLTEDGWYRTQDLLRVDEDGYVHVVGRLSDVIIRSGVNISPAEVERVLRTHPAVADAAVVGLADAVYGQQVVAAVVPATPLDITELDAHARRQLTRYKVPGEYVVVYQLPVNATTGKIDRRALAASLAEGDTP
ncbi:class I adenylate-forming enzyme family protein [Amycolatopsis sp. NPDC003865]